MNILSDPLTSCIFLATSNNGPFLPSITLLNSSKLNSAPCCSSVAASKANSVALILFVLPSGIVTNTMLLDLASVSSKSNTLAFLIFSEYLTLFLASAIALSALLSNANTLAASGLNTLVYGDPSAFILYLL